MATENTPNEPENEPADDQNEPDTEGTEGEPAEYTPPAQDEWDRVRNTAKARKEEVRNLRRELAALKSAKPEADQAPSNAPKDEAPKPDADERFKKVAVVAALTSEGMTKAQAKLAAKLVDLADVHVDDDGDADLEDVIEELRTTFPTMFAPATEAPVRTARPRTSGGRSREGGDTKGPDDKNTDKLLRSAGYR